MKTPETIAARQTRENSRLTVTFASDSLFPQHAAFKCSPQVWSHQQLILWFSPLRKLNINRDGIGLKYNIVTSISRSGSTCRSDRHIDSTSRVDLALYLFGKRCV